MNNISLAKAYEKYFRIGAAVSHRNIDSYADVLSQHFNSITPENEMKYSETEPEEGKFTFDRADKIFGTARKLGIKVRAHAPVWHNQTSAWMYKDGDRPAAPELIYERIEAHTKALCERYNSDVYAWDVVNEAAIDEPDAPPTNAAPAFKRAVLSCICNVALDCAYCAILNPVIDKSHAQLPFKV